MLSNKRRGIALILTLVMCVAIMTSAIAVFSRTRTEAQIAGTTRRIMQAIDLCCDFGDREFMVISTGYYKKADKVISKHVSRSLFKTID